MSTAVLDRPIARTTAGVPGALEFLVASAGKPYVRFADTGGLLDTNADYKPREVFVRNMRLMADALSLDVQGFELIRHETAVADFSNDAEIDVIGRSEAADIVARATGAARVVVFDHTVRRRSPDAARQPSTRVHNDYTEGSAPQRVRDLLGEEADALLAGRVAFINVWRPIRHAAADWPLALCDARSLIPGELIPTDIIYPGRQGEIYGLAHAPHHRWFHAPRMQLDEALLIKCYDSRMDVARFAPHTAFADPSTPANAPPRESVEFRTIAFF